MDLVRTIVVWLGVVLAGCIQPSLTPCGDLACPSGTICVAAVHTCATPAQLDACTDLVDEDACSNGGSIGRCHGGVCFPEGCGNNSLDLGEVCDDGNRGDGDGCSGDCLSLETCGNGYVDRALGEDCDCGTDDATKPAACAMANSNDPSAECSATCHGRCGDGEIRGAEQCDSTNLGALACTDVGFYGGALACSGRCLFDTSACSGRCGDHTLDVGYEVCDGAPPIGACAGAGWDAGEADCGLACRAKTTYCNRFGFRQIEAVSLTGVWGNAQGAVLVERFSGNAWFRDLDGARHDAPGAAYIVAAGSGTTAYAVGDLQTAVWDGATWSTMSSPGGTVRAAWADATSLWALIDAVAWRWDGASWTAYDSGQVGLFLYMAGSSTRVCIAGTRVFCVARATGTWTELTGITAVNIFGIAIEGTSVWAATKQGLYRYIASWTKLDSIPGVAITTMASGGVAVRGATSVTWYSPNPSVRRSLGPIAPTANATYMLVEAGTDLVAGGVDGMYRASTGGWISSATPLTGSVHVMGTGERTISTSVLSVDGLIYTAYFIQTGAGMFLANSYEDTFVAGGILKSATDLGLYAKTGTYWSPEDTVVYTAVAISGDHVLLASQDATHTTNYVRDYTAATTPISTGSDLPTTLAIDGAGAFYIAVSNQIKRYDPGTMTWSSVITTTGFIADMWVAANGDIVAVSDHTISHLRGGVAQTPIDLPTTLTAVAGAGPDDIFVTGSASGVDSTGLFWFDGHAWTPVELSSIPTSPITDIAVNDGIVLYLDSSGAHELTHLSSWLRPP